MGGPKPQLSILKGIPRELLGAHGGSREMGAAKSGGVVPRGPHSR